MLPSATIFLVAQMFRAKKIPPAFFNSVCATKIFFVAHIHFARRKSLVAQIFSGLRDEYVFSSRNYGLRDELIFVAQDFVAQIVKRSSVRRRRREQNLLWVPSLQGAFLQSLYSEDLHSTETVAFVIPEAGDPLGNSLTAHATNIPGCITYPAMEEGSTFEIKHHMLSILPTFHGLSTDDPNMHIAEFLMGCKNILVKGFSAESIKLRLFPYTLKDQARRWLLTLPSGSISTWNQLSSKLLNKYYPASKTLDMRTQILSFSQKPNEEFHEAWERFKYDNKNSCQRFKRRIIQG
ncbi:unnamed protein product [Prunus armeniaca]